ncbi:MAG TPA: hypothetical protein VF874_16315, partial [Mycobacterium sp.]
AMASDLVQELQARAAAQAPKVATTIRISSIMFQRLEVQTKRWGITNSYLIERALEPVLRELEQAEVISDGQGNAGD